MIVRAIPHNSKCRYGERGAADAVPQLPERCLSRKVGIVRCCHKESGTLAAKVRVPDFVVLYRREYVGGC